MILFLIMSCFAHKTTLSGVVDYINDDSCSVELNSGELIVIRSKVCVSAKEGDTIYFYGSRSETR